MFAQQNCKTAAAAAAKKRRRIAKLTLDSIRATNDPHVMTIYYFLQQIIINNNNKQQQTAHCSCNNFPRGSFTCNNFPQQKHRSIARLGSAHAMRE